MITMVAVKMEEITLGDVLDRMYSNQRVLIEWLEERKVDLITVAEARDRYENKLNEEVYNIDGNIGVDKVIAIEMGGE